MTLTRLTALFLTGALLTTTHVHANEIYKIGNKYTQIRPKGVDGVDYKTLPIQNNGNLGAARTPVSEIPTTTTPAPAPAANSDAERAAAAEKALQEQNAKIMAERCENMRRNLAAYNTGGRIYDTNPSTGERIYLNDQEISSKKQRTMDAIAKDCSWFGFKSIWLCK